MVAFRSGRLRAVVRLAALVLVSLAPAAASAYTAEQEQACSGDALRLCSSEIPDVDRITACMIRNKAQLSPPCRAQFDSESDGAAAADDPPEKPVNIKPSAARKPANGQSHKSKKPAKRDAS
jgi:hypothetical protein